MSEGETMDGKIVNEAKIDGRDIDFQWYMENQDFFRARYNGKYLIIKDKKLISVHNEVGDAVDEIMERHEVEPEIDIDTVLVQECSYEEPVIAGKFMDGEEFMKWCFGR